MSDIAPFLVSFTPPALTDKKTDRHAPLTSSSFLLDPGRLAPPFKRKILFHCGPTNSGKTYDALLDLKTKPTGVYAAPLRLLALEGYDALKESVPTRLVTGEETQGEAHAPFTSCTIETLDLNTHVNTLIIDEIQMLCDPKRGWAWTHALLSAKAQTIHLCGSVEALPWIRSILKVTQEDLEIITHTRKSPLHAHIRPQSPKPGDALIAFSRKAALDLRDELRALGFSPALIYGALPPEIRRDEAHKFQTGQADILVATDAIGMGLNLPIRRILFSSLTKFDGEKMRPLLDEEIRQIAGRAGRMGLFEEGYVGLYQTACLDHSATLARALPAPKKSRKNVKPYWRPLCGLTHAPNLSDFLITRFEDLKRTNGPFQGVCDEDLLWRAAHIDPSTPRADAIKLLAAPVGQNDITAPLFLALCKGEPLPLDTPGEVKTRDDLARLEEWIRLATFVRWIDARWPGEFVETNTLTTRWQDGIEAFKKALTRPFGT